MGDDASSKAKQKEEQAGDEIMTTTHLVALRHTRDSSTGSGSSDDGGGSRGRTSRDITTTIFASVEETKVTKSSATTKKKKKNAEKLAKATTDDSRSCKRRKLGESGGAEQTSEAEGEERDAEAFHGRPVADIISTCAEILAKIDNTPAGMTHAAATPVSPSQQQDETDGMSLSLKGVPKSSSQSDAMDTTEASVSPSCMKATATLMEQATPNAPSSPQIERNKEEALRVDDHSTTFSNDDDDNNKAASSSLLEIKGGSNMSKPSETEKRKNKLASSKNRSGEKNAAERARLLRSRCRKGDEKGKTPLVPKSVMKEPPPAASGIPDSSMDMRRMIDYQHGAAALDHGERVRLLLAEQQQNGRAAAHTGNQKDATMVAADEMQHRDELTTGARSQSSVSANVEASTTDRLREGEWQQSVPPIDSEIDLTLGETGRRQSSRQQTAHTAPGGEGESQSLGERLALAHMVRTGVAIGFGGRTMGAPRTDVEPPSRSQDQQQGGIEDQITQEGLARDQHHGGPINNRVAGGYDASAPSIALEVGDQIPTSGSGLEFTNPSERGGEHNRMLLERENQRTREALAARQQRLQQANTEQLLPQVAQAAASPAGLHNEMQSASVRFGEPSGSQQGHFSSTMTLQEQRRMRALEQENLVMRAQLAGRQRQQDSNHLPVAAQQQVLPASPVAQQHGPAFAPSASNVLQRRQGGSGYAFPVAGPEVATPLIADERSSDEGPSSYEQRYLHQRYLSYQLRSELSELIKDSKSAAAGDNAGKKKRSKRVKDPVAENARLKEHTRVLEVKIALQKQAMREEEQKTRAATRGSQMPAHHQPQQPTPSLDHVSLVIAEGDSEECKDLKRRNFLSQRNIERSVQERANALSEHGDMQKKIGLLGSEVERRKVVGASMEKELAALERNVKDCKEKVDRLEQGLRESCSVSQNLAGRVHVLESVNFLIQREAEERGMRLEAPTESVTATPSANEQFHLLIRRQAEEREDHSAALSSCTPDDTASHQVQIMQSPGGEQLHHAQQATGIINNDSIAAMHHRGMVAGYRTTQF